MRIIAAAAATACLASNVWAQDVPPVRLPSSWAAMQAGAALQADASPVRDTGKDYLLPAAEIVGFDVLLNLYDRQYFGCCEFHSTARSIRRNLRSSWVTDRDPFLVNQLGHPYQGSMYHGFARASGLSYWEGLAYTFAGSAFWEIAGETGPPSRNDQINTGIGGSFLGEALFRLSHLVLEREGNMSPFLREIVAAAISPPVGFNRNAFGERFRSNFSSRDPLYLARLQLGFSGTAHSDAGSSTTKLHRDEALADFLIDYGLPGKLGYEYTRPFDYFTLQATASSANGFENVLTRGLLIGKGYEGRNYRGVWGLYGSYDYIEPQTYRVASTSVSLGTTGQWWINDSTALLGTVMTGIGYTAASSTHSSDDRDFHYGVAPLALISMRLVYRDCCAIDVTAREYYISRVGGAAGGGHENIARVDATFTWRIKKGHGVSIKYLGNSRDVSFPDIGNRSQNRGTVGLFYTFLGHDLFGVSER